MTTPGGMNRDVNVTLSANVDPFQRAMHVASTGVTTLTGQVVTLAKKIDELWKSTGRKLEIFGAGGLASLVAATEAASRLDAQFRSVRATAALTGQSVGALKDQAAGLARALPASNSAIAQLMGQVQDLGVKGTANITKFTEVAIRLSAATNTPPGQLFSGILQLTRSMNGSIQNLDRYSSSLVSLSKNNGVASQQILDFSNAIEAVAQRAGYTQTQVMGLSTAFAKAGADSGAGATAFIKMTNDISEAIRTGSQQLNIYANIVGESREKFQQMAQGNPAEAFIKVINAIRDSGPKGISILQQLGLDGVRTQRAIAALTSGQANLKDALNQSSDAYTKNTALNKASNAAYNDLSSQMMKFRTAVAQITEAIGGPFLGVASKFMEALTKILNLFNNLPGPVKTGIGILAAVGSSLTLLVGAGALAVLFLLKFTAVWRVMSGAVGSNVFKGILDGFRGMPREIDNTSTAMNRLYQSTYKVTDRLKGSGLDSGRGSIFGFPIRKLRAEIVEMGDTIDPRGGANSKLADYRSRNDDMTSRYSLNGARAAAQKWARENERFSTASRTLFGDPGETATRLQTENDRLIQIAQKRKDAFKKYADDLANLRRANPAAFDVMAADYHNMGRRPAQQVTDLGQVNDKMRTRFVNNAAMRKANEEAQSLQNSFKEQDGDAAISPFKNMANKVKTLSAEMVESIGGGAAKIMDIVSATFGASVAKIVELAAKAKMALIEIQGGAGGPALAGLSSGILAMGNAGAAAGARVSSMATEMAATVGTNASVAGAIGRHSLRGSGGRFVSQAQLLEEEALTQGAASSPGRFARARAAVVNSPFGAVGSRIGSGLGAAAEAAGNGLSRLGGMITPMLGPMALWGTLLFMGGEAIHSFADKGRKAALAMGNAGEEFAKVVGMAYKLPSYTDAQKNPADAPVAYSPYSNAEFKTASSADFYNKNKGSLDRFSALKGNRGTQDQEAFAKTLLGTLVAGNQGQALTGSAAQNYREMLLRVFGADKGKILAQQNLTNQGSGIAQIQGIEGLVRSAYRGSSNATFTGTSGKGAQAAYMAVGQNAMQVDDKGRPIYAAADLLAATKVGSGYSSYDRSLNFNAVTKGISNQYKSVTGSGIDLQHVSDIQGVLGKLTGPGSSDTAKKYGADLKAVLDSVGYNGKNATAALEKLSIQLAITAKAAADDPNSTANRLKRSRLGRDILGSKLDFQNNADNPSFGLGVLALNQRAGNQPNGQAGLFNDISTYTRQLAHWMEVRNSGVTGAMLDTATSQITQAQAGIGQQRQFGMSAPNQMGAYAKDLQALSQGPEAFKNTAEIQQAYEAMSATYNASLDTLKGYVLQVRQVNRQRLYNEQDHTLQLQHMYRDRALQEKEALHTYNETIRASMYETAQSYGNPGAFVQSQYTQSATSAFTGLGQQNNLLQRSKVGMDQLAKMGVSKDVIRLFGLDDPKNVTQVERFVHDLAANPKLIKQFNDAIKGRLKISEGIATDVNNAKFAEMKRQFDYTGKQAAAAFQRSLGDFEKAYRTAADREKDSLAELARDTSMSVTDIMKAAKNSGVANIQAYANAIQAKSKDVVAAIKAMTDAGVNAAGIGSGGTTGSGVGAGGAGSAGGGGGSRADRPGGLSTNLGTKTSAPSASFGSVSNQRLAQQMAASYGWSGGMEWNALQRLWGQESGWRTNAGSPGAAYGIPQASPGTKMASAGQDWKTNPRTQIKWGLDHIAMVYNDPIGAVRHKDATDTRLGADPAVKYNQPGGWYGAGVITKGPKVIGVGEAGPEMVLPLNGAGASFLTSVVALTMQRSGLTMGTMKGNRTAGHAGGTVYNGDINHHLDASTNFTGDVTVVAQDPNEMARKLADKQRLSALTRPPSSRGK